VSHAYNSYSLLRTGKDQWGQILPILNFRAYGDYPAALNLYFTVPSIALFGPTDFAARLPHAIAGLFTVIAVGIAAYKWTKNKYVLHLAMILCCFDPWTFFTSRTVLQSNWAVLFASLSLAYLASSSRIYFLTQILGLLSYHNARIFIPLISLAIMFYYRKFSLAHTLLVIISAAIILNPVARARNSWVGIVDAGAIAHIESLRANSNWPPIVSKLIFNRPIYFLSTAMRNYLDYFSPQFLFIAGGTQYQFSLPKFGVLSPAHYLLFYPALLVLILKIKTHSRLAPVLLWLALAPVAAAITRDRYAVVRATLMIPAVQITSAYLLSQASRRVQQPLLFVCVFINAALSLPYFSTYFTKYSLQYSQSWQYGHQQLIAYLNKSGLSQQPLLITKAYGEPHEFFLWYSKISPLKYQTDPTKITDFHANWYWVDSFSNYTFVNDWDLPSTSWSGVVIASPANPPKHGQLHTVINYLDEKPAFLVYRL
jgi:hypothetical protein